MSTPVPGVLTGPRMPDSRAPIDEFDVAVRLETQGVTDEVAHALYGYGSTMRMAVAEFPRMASEASGLRVPAPSESWLKAFLHGASYAVPMFISALAIALQGFSLWGGDLEGETASAVAVGVVASFILAGGFVQGLALRMSFYLGIGEHSSAVKVAGLWSGAGMLFLCSASAVFLAVNTLFRWMPFSLGVTSAGFAISLGALFLASAALYVLEMRLAVAGATLAGLAVTTVCVRILDQPVLPGQFLGIWTATGAAVAAAWSRLGPLCRQSTTTIRTFTVARETLIAWASAAAGVLYYLLLFSDRMIAWTAGTQAALLPVMFRGDYETAVGLAMILFVLGAGWVHASTAAFRHWAQDSRTVASAAEPWRLNQNAGRRLLGGIPLFLPLPVLGAVAIYYTAQSLDLLSSPEMERVLVVALTAYPLLVIGLWGRSILEMLNLVHHGLLPAAAAVLADLVIGYVLTRTGTYSLAIYSFLCGSAVFAAGMILAARRACRQFDHHYFAAHL
ncbi:MAG: hypothetical protein FJW39_07355 [Acidobacteria bacterium]|nr:hypothetical protein [Acidobacteriota bacterium]